MKKIYLLSLSLFLAVFLSAQTYVSEDFSAGTMPPDGWVQLPLTTGWVSSATSNASGIAPECKFESIPQSGYARLISPATNQNSTDTAAILFKHSYKKAGTGVTIGVATRHGGDWTSIWSITPTDDIEAEEVSIQLVGDEVTGSYFQFCFYVEGEFSSVDGWFIDDVEFFSPIDFDAKMSTILVPDVITEPTPISAKVLNMGKTTITDVNVTWVSYAGIERDSTFTDLDLEFAESAEINFDGSWASPLGSHDLRMWINDVNGSKDMNQENDSLTKTIEYQSVVYPVTPLYEEFTSSTCSPCASFNSSFVPWCNQHADEISLIKYQMNWPGAGDPYYTAEGGTRRNYYGVNAVPQLFGQGSDIGANVSSANSLLQQTQSQTTTFDIASSFTMTGSTIHITTNILSFANTPSYKVHNVIVEKLTTENTATNGETEFEHVMMKMMPGASGTAKSFVSGVPAQFTYTHDMSTTNVEELDDLLVVVFIQNNSTKEIIQSAYGEMDVEYSSEARLSEITLDGEPLEDFDPDTYTYTVQQPEGTVEEPVLGSTPMDENATVITNMAGDDEKDMTDFVKVYPNPANDMLTLKGFENANVSVISTSGAVVLQKNGFNGGQLDISKLSPGVYFVNIRLSNNQLVHKKIIVL